MKTTDLTMMFFSSYVLYTVRMYAVISRAPTIPIYIFLYDGKHYPASPSSSRRNQTNLITCISNHTTFSQCVWRMQICIFILNARLQIITFFAHLWLNEVHCIDLIDSYYTVITEFYAQIPRSNYRCQYRV